MKFCEECGAKLDDDVLFCDECGASVDSLEESEVVAHIPHQEAKTQLTNVNKKPLNKFVITVSAIGAVLVAVIIVLVVLLLKKDDSAPIPNNHDTTAIQAENEPTTEIPTTETDTTESTTDDEYKYLDQFINIANNCGLVTIGEASEEYAMEYYKEAYNLWLRGEDYSEIIIDENGNLDSEFFFGNPYGVYWFWGNSVHGEFYFHINKQNTVYEVLFIQYVNGEPEYYGTMITDKPLLMYNENIINFSIDDDYYTDMNISIKLTGGYNTFSSSCDLSITATSTNGLTLHYVDEIISNTDINTRTFMNFSDYRAYVEG